MARASDETLRRRLFHGWAFQGHRGTEQTTALRGWLDDGELTPERAHYMHKTDLEMIEGFDDFKASQA